MEYAQRGKNLRLLFIRFDIHLYSIQLTYVKGFFDSKVKRIKVKKK